MFSGEFPELFERFHGGRPLFDWNLEPSGRAHGTVSGLVLKATPPATRSGAGPSDAVLVLSARAGEGWAKEALFRRYAPMVNGLAYRLLGTDSDLDDLVQESFAAALSSLDKLRNTETFPSWLSAIVVRTANKLLRRRNLMRRLGLRSAEPVNLEAVPSRSMPPDVALELNILYSVVARMPPKLQIPLLLRHFEEASLEEIGSMLGISLATVKRRLSAAQAALQTARAGEKGGGRA